MQAPSAARLIRFTLLAGAAGSLTACVSVPHLGPAPQPKPAAAYAASQTFGAPAAEWPSDQWWAAYGDPQLDELIGEALAGAPDLAKARARVRQAEAFRETAASTLGPHLTAVASVAEVKQSYNNGIPSAIVPHGWNDAGLAGLSSRLGARSLRQEPRVARRGDLRGRRGAGRRSRGAADALHRRGLRLRRPRAALCRPRRGPGSLRVRTDSEKLISARCAQGLETQAALERAHAGRATAEAHLAAVDEQIGLDPQPASRRCLGQGPDRGLAIARPAPGAIRAFGLPANLQADLIGRRPDVVAARLARRGRGQADQGRQGGLLSEHQPVRLHRRPVAGLGHADQVGLGHRQASARRSACRSSNAGGCRRNYRGARGDYDDAVANYDQTLTQALQEVADSAVSARALDARLGQEPARPWPPRRRLDLHAAALRPRPRHLPRRAYRRGRPDRQPPRGGRPRDPRLHPRRRPRPRAGRRLPRLIPDFTSSRSYPCEQAPRHPSNCKPQPRDAGHPARASARPCSSRSVGGVAVAGARLLDLPDCRRAKHVSTDNAYVDAESAQVTALTGGPVADVRVGRHPARQEGRRAGGDRRHRSRLALAQAEPGAWPGRAHACAATTPTTGRARRPGRRARQADLARAQAELGQRAQVEYDRRQALAGTGAVSGEELTSVQDRRLAAGPGGLRPGPGERHARPQARARQANEVLIAGDARAQSRGRRRARQRLEQAQLDLERTVVRAPGRRRRHQARTSRSASGPARRAADDRGADPGGLRRRQLQGGPAAQGADRPAGRRSPATSTAAA